MTEDDLSLDDWRDCREYKDCACGGAIRPARHSPQGCTPIARPTRLADTGQIYVTLRAAREYAALPSEAEIALGEEEARRALTTRLLDARRAPGKDRPPLESWRLRRSHEPELSVFVSREGPLAVVVTVHGTRRF